MGRNEPLPFWLSVRRHTPIPMEVENLGRRLWPPRHFARDGWERRPRLVARRRARLAGRTV